MQNLTLDLSGVINTAIDEKFKDFDVEGQIKEMLGDVAKQASKVLTVKLAGEDGEGRKFPLVHKQFEDLLLPVSVGENVMITGGAGLSKSTAVVQASEALNLELTSMSFSNQTTKTDLMGFVDANGIYRESGFVKRFIHGGVFLADEMDACSANVFVLLNSAIENGFMTLPDGKKVDAHENFRFVGTANTNGRGAKDGFTARNRMDAATLDRFVVIEWVLDEDLEQKITDNDAWLNIVRKARKACEKQLDGVVITPRPSYKGAKLLKAGADVEKVIEWTLVKGMGKDERETILKAITKADKDAVRGDVEPEVKEVAEVIEKLEKKAEEVEAKIEVEAEAKEAEDDTEVDFGEW